MRRAQENEKMTFDTTNVSGPCVRRASSSGFARSHASHIIDHRDRAVLLLFVVSLRLHFIPPTLIIVKKIAKCILTLVAVFENQETIHNVVGLWRVV